MATQPEAHPGRERTRDALALRRQHLEEARPEVLDLAADALTAIRERLHGRATEARGEHAGPFWRSVLRGEHALTIEDLARLCIDEPVAACGALRLLAEETGHRLEPLFAGEAGLGDAGAGVALSGGRVQADVLSAVADGRVDAAELACIERSLEAHKAHVAALEAAAARLRKGA